MAKYNRSRLKSIFDATDGRCHLCRAPLDFEDYGHTWEVDHSRPKSRGGSDSLRNLRPACVSCNRSKRNRSSRSVRAAHGYRRAPRSRGARLRAGAAGALVGGILGAAAGVNPLLGAAFGFLAGQRDPR